MNEPINPKKNAQVYADIISSPFITLGSIGKVSSCEKLRPIGIIGSKKIPSRIVLTKIRGKFLVGNEMKVKNRQKAVPKQDIRSINRCT